MKDLLLGFVADGAGVVEDQSRFFYGLDLAISLVHQCADDFLRVMHIHLAAKGFKVKRFFLLCAHSIQYNAANKHSAFSSQHSAVTHPHEYNENFQHGGTEVREEMVPDL